MSLDRLLGTWGFTMRHVAVPEPVTGQHTYERVLDDAFVTMRCTYDHPDFPNALSVLDEDTSHYFDVRGVIRIFDSTIDETGWSTIRRDEDFWQRSSVTFVGPNGMEGTGEVSHDRGATWEHDYSVTYARLD